MADAPELLAQIRELYASGLNQAEVGLRLGLTRRLVQKLMRRNGLKARRRPPKPFSECYREDANGCWVWTRFLNEWGYGHYWGTGAHRWSYAHHKGLIPAGMLVMHECDNPACVNPDHLKLGTQADNMLDMSRKGRARAQGVTHCPSGHEYSDENTYRNSRGHRFCRMCNRAAQAAYRAKKRVIL